MDSERRDLKRCQRNPSHIWMADIPFCPYCNISPEARAWYLEQERNKARQARKKESK